MDAEIVVYDWYKSLVADCHAIVTERLWRSRQEVIEGWHEVGMRIATDENYSKFAKGNGEIKKRLAADIGASMQSLYFALQFYEKHPNLSNALDSFPEGKNISWHKICNKYLAAPKDESEIKPSISVEVALQKVDAAAQYVIENYPDWIDAMNQRYWKLQGGEWK